jgi:hypothetical protein
VEIDPGWHTDMINYKADPLEVEAGKKISGLLDSVKNGPEDMTMVVARAEYLFRPVNHVDGEHPGYTVQRTLRGYKAAAMHAGARPVFSILDYEVLDAPTQLPEGVFSIAVDCVSIDYIYEGKRITDALSDDEMTTLVER